MKVKVNVKRVIEYSEIIDVASMLDSRFTSEKEWINYMKNKPESLFDDIDFTDAKYSQYEHSCTIQELP
jgi:hypothetical protein